MSQETSIQNLGNNVSDEDSRLVESILNDLNGEKSQQAPQQVPQQAPQMVQGGGQQLSPEQIKQIQMQRQMAMQQQQQMLMQQQQNLSKKNLQETESVNLNNTDDIIENIKKESKSIILVILLSVVLNLEQVDNLFKMQPTLFLTEGGCINMQGILIKAIVMGVIYYLVKSYVL